MEIKIFKTKILSHTFKFINVSVLVLKIHSFQTLHELLIKNKLYNKVKVLKNVQYIM